VFVDRVITQPHWTASY